MGALRLPKPTAEPDRKPASAETRRLDQYGRDPDSPQEKLRARTDYKTGDGWAPLFHAVMSDLPRLTSGNVCTLLVLSINSLSYGRPRNGKTWESSTSPISTAELAGLLSCNVRDVQRQLGEMSDRGMIHMKTIKNGTTKYVISLLYSKWRELEDYAVWKRKQVLPIDQDQETDETEDEAPAAISKDAIQLFKKPAVARPGRATRAAKISGGVKDIVCQNDSPTVDAAFTAVLESGRLTVCATFKTGESEAKGEGKENAERHPRLALPPNEGSDEKRKSGESHPRQQEIVNLFDPLLQKSGSRLLSPDTKALNLACAELGNLPHDALVYFVLGPNGRGGRPISGPAVVKSIVREARMNWDAGERSAPAGLRCKCGGEVMDVQAGLCARCLG